VTLLENNTCRCDEGPHVVKTEFFKQLFETAHRQPSLAEIHPAEECDIALHGQLFFSPTAKNGLEVWRLFFGGDDADLNLLESSLFPASGADRFRAKPGSGSP